MKKILISAFIALSASAMAQDAATTNACSVSIDSNDAMQFNLKEFEINKSQCPEFSITLKHVGNLPAAAMGHNVVITQASDKDAVLKDGLAFPANGYLKEGDERVVAHTKLIGGQEETSVSFPTKDLDASKAYEFFCSFPAHATIMNGKVKVVE